MRKTREFICLYFNTDIDNNERLALGVDIGADEFTDSCSVGFVSMISIQDSFL